MLCENFILAGVSGSRSVGGRLAFCARRRRASAQNLSRVKRVARGRCSDEVAFSWSASCPDPSAASDCELLAGAKDRSVIPSCLGRADVDADALEVGLLAVWKSTSSKVSLLAGGATVELVPEGGRPERTIVQERGA